MSHQPWKGLLDVEEVVRCRNCVHSRRSGTECTYFSGYWPVGYGDEFKEENAIVRPDGYCAWGEDKNA